MKNLARLAAALAAAAAFAAPAAFAQQDAADSPYAPEEDAATTPVAAYADTPDAPIPSVTPYSQQDLDQMLAPIALYPDDLLAQVLMASTYPLEVVQAARWSRSHPGSGGENAVALVDNGDWDPSVKSLVAFPDILAMMDEKLDWTQRLGEAFLADQASVMGTVQKLRRAASDAGNLASNPNMVVNASGGDYAIAPAQPDEMYMPYYDPRQIYGPWWWPAAPPVYWAPWSDYSLFSGYGYCWAPPVVLSVNFFFGGFNWHAHHVVVHDHRPFYYHGHDHRPIVVHNATWQHDPTHRRGVQYHNPILRTQFASGRVAPAGRADHVRPRTNEARPNGNPAARTVSVPNANPAARAERPQGGFFPQPRPAPQNEAQAREVPNATARPPAYVHYARPPVDAPQVHYANPQQGHYANPPPQVPVNGAPAPQGRVVQQAPAPAPAPREGGERAEGHGGQGIQRGSSGPDMRGAGGRER